jgi:hypothetical protein
MPAASFAQLQKEREDERRVLAERSLPVSRITLTEVREPGSHMIVDVTAYAAKTDSEQFRLKSGWKHFAPLRSIHTRDEMYYWFVILRTVPPRRSPIGDGSRSCASRLHGGSHGIIRKRPAQVPAAQHSDVELKSSTILPNAA